MKIVRPGSSISRSCNECDLDKDIKEITVGKVVIALCKDCRLRLGANLVKKERTSRNPERIPILLKELKVLWLKNPDIRFGQLVYNIMSGINTDMFYVEDDKLLEEMKNVKKGNRYDL